MGHPWDLWGLSKIFDGSDSTKTLVRAEEPNGLPTFDAINKEAINRFRVWGYDVAARLTSAELLWDEGKGRVDLQDMRSIADNLIERINGTAQLFDPQYKPVKPLALTWSKGDAAGASAYSEWTPNKSSTNLARFPDLIPLARDIIALAAKEKAVKFVLDAIVLPRTWASLYLVYDAISTDMGGTHSLKKKNWVTEDDLSDFTNSANNSREIKEGARHGKKPEQSRALISMEQAYTIINQLALAWLSEKAGMQKIWSRYEVAP
jgi:hypothetical protein